MENSTQRNPEIDERVRLLGVYRLWTQALGSRLGPSWLASSRFREIAAGVACMTAVLLLPLDEALWSLQGTFFPWSRQRWLPRSGEIAAAALLGSYTVNTFLLHRSLAWSTRKPGIYRRWIVVLRSLLCGIPLVGLYVVPAWSWIQQARPAWALRSDPGAAEALRLDEHQRLRSIQGSAPHEISLRSLVVIVIGGLAALLLNVLWLSSSAGHGSLLGLSLALHASQFVALALCVQLETVPRSVSRTRVALLSALTAAWLIPLPYVPLLGILPVLFLDPGLAQSSTLIWQVLVRRKGAGRLPIWLGLEDTLRAGWEALPIRERLRKPLRPLGAPETVRRSEHQVLKLYDLVSFSLLFDAAILSWALFPLSPLAGVLAWVVTACLALSALGACAAALQTCLVLLRVPGRVRTFDRHPYAGYLARTQLAAAAGLWLGSALRQDLGMEAGLLLMLCCSLLLILAVLSLALKNISSRTPLLRRTFRDEAYNFGVLFALMPVFGLGGPLGLLPRLFLIWMVLLPLRALWMARTLLPWLLRPFEIRDLFARRGLPPHLRLGLGVLATSALLPLGGWLVPLCIGVRHRLWPEAEAVEWKERTA